MTETNRKGLMAPILALLVVGTMLSASCAPRKAPNPSPPSGVPDPPPIIEVIEDGGDMRVEVGNTELSTPTENEIDEEAVKEVTGGLLIDSIKATGSKKDFFYIPQHTTILVKFDDGKWFTVRRGGAGDSLVWTCYEPGSPPDIIDIIPSGLGSGKIPSCIRRSGVTEIKFSSDSKTYKGDMILMFQKTEE